MKRILHYLRRIYEKARTQQTKIEIARRGALPTKLNIGCGFDKREGFLNIDIDRSCQPDILFYSNDLSPLPSGYFDAILAHDVLEHIPRDQTMNALLEWAALLKMDGTLTLQTSDIIGITTRMQENPTFEFQFNWTALMFGNQMHRGDFHFNGFTDRTLRVHLDAAGFEVSRFDIKDGWLLSATVRKIADWQQPLSAMQDLSDREFMMKVYSLILERTASPDEIKRWPTWKSLSTRRSALKRVVGSPENLYKIGARI